MKVFVDMHDKRWKKYKIDFAKIANAVVGNKYKNADKRAQDFAKRLIDAEDKLMEDLRAYV